MHTTRYRIVRKQPNIQMELSDINIKNKLIATCASTALALSIFMPSAAQAIEVEEIDAAKEQAEQIKSNIDALQTELNAASKEYEAAVSAYNTANQAMKEAQARMDEAEAKIADLQEELGDTANNMYKRSSVTSYIDVLLGANTFTDFVNGWDMFSRVTNKEAELVQQTKDLRAEADSARAEYEFQKQQAEEEMSIAQEKQLSIAQKKSSLAEEAAQITQEISDMEDQYELEAEAARRAALAAQAASAAYAESLKAGGNMDVGNGYFANPCPDSWESSGWGYRSFDNKFHLGTDMAANMGAPVYAAEAGTVIGVSTNGSYNGGAGNYVTISHGNGLVTKYFHLSTAFVAVGDIVERGQNIAAVGSTGKSTGPHLHFQVEVNGTPVCPYDFL